MRHTEKTGRLLALHLFIISALNMTATISAAIDTKAYENYMRQLIKLGKEENPHNPFAAMIIDSKSGTILCRGVFDPTVNRTYHGELVAINNCVAKFPRLNWANTTLITDAEPCAMCAGAIVWTGIPRIVYGSSVPFFIKHHWMQINVRSEYVIKNSAFYKGTVIGGVLHQETDKLFADAYGPKNHSIKKS